MGALTFVLLVLLALLGGGVAQHFFAETPGHVLIVFGENSYLMSLILFFIVLFITMVSLYALIHLVRRTLAAPGGFMRWPTGVLDTPGTFTGEIEITYGDGGIQTVFDQMKFKVRGDY